MTVLVILVLFALIALGLILYFAFRIPARVAERSLPQTFTVDSFFDLNVRHFAHIRQVLSRSDYDYLRGRGPSCLARRLRRERLEVLTSYVRGLRDDFQNLLHLYQLLGRLEGEAVREHLVGVVLLEYQFRVLYLLVIAKLALARLTLAPVNIEPLVAVVHRMAEATEAALNQLAEAQTRQLRTELS